MTQKLILPFEVKEAVEGKFTGMASVYGEVDLGKDVVERGAFAKTISENPVVPILWQHNSKEAPIGKGTLRNTREGLAIDAELDMEDPLGVHAFRKLKMGLLKGLSIGFESVTDEIKSGIRHLKEIKLWEVSIVTFPMLPSAQVTSVKQMILSHKADFTTELEAAQTWASRRMMCNALDDSLASFIWDNTKTPEEKISASELSIAQFAAAYVEALPKYLALMDANSGGMYYHQIGDFDKKDGKALSDSYKSGIEAAQKTLQALLTKAAEGTLKSEPAAAPGPETGYHSALIHNLKESLRWNSTNS